MNKTPAKALLDEPITEAMIGAGKAAVWKLMEENKHRVLRLEEQLPPIYTAMRSSAPQEPDDETYEIGKRDGYELAVQEIDQATGGDGEYRYVMGVASDRHCPDAATMKARIVDRFKVAQEPVVDDDAEWLREFVQHMRNGQGKELAHGAVFERLLAIANRLQAKT